MQNLLLFLLRYGNFFTFFVLEAVCFYLIVQYNDPQKEIFIYSSNLASGTLYEKYDNTRTYLHLREINDSLAEDNAHLIDQVYSLRGRDTMSTHDIPELYSVIPIKIINNSFTRRNNMLTLNKGAEDGMKKSMGIIHPKGLIGVVTHVSPHYSTAISILNTQVQVSAKIARTHHFGTLSWNAENGKELILSAIPKHADVRVGDTVTTTSFSTIFPPDLPIGTVTYVSQPPGRGDFVLTVRLFIDLSSVTYGYAICHRDKEEILSLEKLQEE